MTVYFSSTARVLLFVAAALLLGQAPAGAQSLKWWQDEAFQRKLSLSSEQSRRIEDTFQSALPDLRHSKTQLDGLEAELSRLVETGADDTVLAQQIARVEDARADLNKTRTLMLLRIRRILTVDQRVKLDAIHKQRRGDSPSPDKRP